MSPSSCLVIVFGVRVVELSSLVLAQGTHLREVHAGELLQELFFRKAVRDIRFSGTPFNLLSFLFVDLVFLLYRLWFSVAGCVLA